MFWCQGKLAVCLYKRKFIVLSGKLKVSDFNQPVIVTDKKVPVLFSYYKTTSMKFGISSVIIKAETTFSPRKQKLHV